MSGKIEAGFWVSVERLLPDNIYAESMSNIWKSGTPDRYYEGSGKKPILFVEWKAFRKPPVKLDLVGEKILSAKQYLWLKRAHSNKVPVAVMVGFTESRTGLIFPGLECIHVLSREQCIKEAFPKEVLAKWIAERVM